MTAARHELSPSKGTTFDHLLVWGIPFDEVPMLLRQASTVVTPGDGRIRLVKPRTASRFIRVGAEPLDSVVDSINRMGVALQREGIDEEAAEDIVQLAVVGKHDLTRRSVAALHPEARRETGRAVAVRVAPLGAGVAATLGAELHVLHVWVVFSEQLR
jgi:hypothetical protein